MDSRAFCNVLELWCGGDDFQELDWDAIQQLACVADRFQISEVVAALEDSMMGTLSVEVCVEMLNWSSVVGLRRLEAEARKMTSERFDEIMATPGFMNIEEETFRSILEERGVDEVTTPHAMRLCDAPSTRQRWSHTAQRCAYEAYL